MNETASQLQRFLYSHHLLSGFRRAAGTLLPVTILGGLLGWYAAGLVATFGALCVAFIDQPGPHENRRWEMLGGTLLSTFTVAITSLASNYPLILWFVVIGQCFAYSMLSVYGKKGGQIGFACLLLMTVTMHEGLSADLVWMHTLTSFGGGLFYTVFSYSLSRAMNLREKEQALSVALFATSNYVAQRADMYNIDRDLDESYRKLISSQSNMTDKQQAARDMVFRGLSGKITSNQPKRIMLWNLFVDMIEILDTLVATRTDYSLLCTKLADSDILIFMRDALYKMSVDLDRVALAVSRNRVASARNSVKAELRALEFEIDQMERSGYALQEPDVYSLCVEILRRLRHSANTVQRMISSTDLSKNTQAIQATVLDQSLSQFLSREKYRLGMITSNLRLDSPICRYALRVTLAAACAMAIWALVPCARATRLLDFADRSDHHEARLCLDPPAQWLEAVRNADWLRGGARRFVQHRQRHLAFCSHGHVHDYWRQPAAAQLYDRLRSLIRMPCCWPFTLSIRLRQRSSPTVRSTRSSAQSFHLPAATFCHGGSHSLCPRSLGRRSMRIGSTCAPAYVMSTRFKQIKRILETAMFSALRVAWRLTRKNVYVALGNFAEAFYRMMREPRARDNGM